MTNRQEAIKSAGFKPHDVQYVFVTLVPSIHRLELDPVLQ